MNTAAARDQRCRRRQTLLGDPLAGQRDRARLRAIPRRVVPVDDERAAQRRIGIPAAAPMAARVRAEVGVDRASAQDVVDRCRPGRGRVPPARAAAEAAELDEVAGVE